MGKHVYAATVMHETGEIVFCLKKIIGATSSVDSWQSVLYWNLEGRT
jgi:hypothetical protein